MLMAVPISPISSLGKIHIPSSAIKPDAMGSSSRKDHFLSRDCRLIAMAAATPATAIAIVKRLFALSEVCWALFLATAEPEAADETAADEVLDEAACGADAVA